MEAVKKHVSNDQVWPLEDSLSPQPITEHGSNRNTCSSLIKKIFVENILVCVSWRGCKATTGRVTMNLESVLYSNPSEYSLSFPQKVLKHRIGYFCYNKKVSVNDLLPMVIFFMFACSNHRRDYLCSGMVFCFYLRQFLSSQLVLLRREPYLPIKQGDILPPLHFLSKTV